MSEAGDDQALVRVRCTLTGSPVPIKDRTAEQARQAVLKAATAGHEGGVTADQVSS
ncbi:hypothetical protein ACFYY8_29620 [Streptosporangium sp. NPDC001559]|uniref:hypothetical protein n=1 Tax=Streptosporangium sp. NPDC001559 TaxID=3366187 RepID=UPI0036E08A04